MKIVIKIGGSLLFDDFGPNVNYIKNLLRVLKKIRKKHKIILAVVGGKVARNYIKRAKELGISDEASEWIAIEILKANVRLFSYLLSMPPVFNLEDVKNNDECVLGGICPGRSTDANATLAAKIANADVFIKATNVDGIYTKDPKKFKAAKKIEKMSFAELRRFKTKGKPGSYGILDGLAIENIVKNRIRTLVINGENPKNILRAIKGEKIGTEICD